MEVVLLTDDLYQIVWAWNYKYYTLLNSMSHCYTVLDYSELVKQDGHLTDIEEYVVLTLISYITREVLSNATVPVGSVIRVEELLHELTNVGLLFELIHGVINLHFNITLHVWVHLLDHKLDNSFSHIII